MRLMSYLKAGPGRGIRVVLVFALIFCLFLGGAFYQGIRTLKANETVLSVIRQLPEVTIQENRITSPENFYRQIKLPGTTGAALIIDTTGATEDPSFREGFYVTKERILFQSGTFSRYYPISYPDGKLTQEVWQQLMVRSFWMMAAFFIGIAFILILLGYFLLYLSSILLFWIPKMAVSKELLGRLSAVVWIMLLILDSVLLTFGFGLPLITILLIALSIVLVGALKLRTGRTTDF